MSEPDEHTRDGLLVKLRRDCDAVPDQLRLVEAALDFFGSRQLLRDGRALPLYAACPCATECWAPFAAGDRPPPHEAEASVPWVGRDFRRRRIAVVAINFNAYGGLGAQWWVRRGDIHERLGQGKRALFPYRVGQYLAALIAAQDGEPVIADPDPAAGARGLEACAFVQAVQCSPKPEVGRPSEAMWRNCPPRYLAGQLALLQPRVILVVGRPVWPWVRDLCGVEVSEYRPSLWRGAGHFAGADVEAFFVNHPSWGGWRYSLPRLLESLAHRSLSGHAER